MTGAHLIADPASLLAQAEITPTKVVDSNRREFAAAIKKGGEGLDAQCSALLREIRNCGYQRGGKPAPLSASALLKSANAGDSFCGVTVGAPGSRKKVKLTIATFAFDTNSRFGSRAYLDVVVCPSKPRDSFAQLTTTNNWSDDPKRVQANKAGIKVNLENRFFVDVAFAPSTGSGESLTVGVVWYRYWWYDSHHHPWWWFGPYWWWSRYNRWYGIVRPWWWNWWWPRWHWQHWYGWSNWWSHLIPERNID